VEEAKVDAKAFLCKLPSSFVPCVGTPRPRAESLFPSVLPGSSARAIPLESTPQGLRPFTARDSNPGNLATTTANYYWPSRLVRAIRALVSLTPCRVHQPSIDFSLWTAPGEGERLEAPRHGATLLRDDNGVGVSSS
jgi:hypothetical protein